MGGKHTPEKAKRSQLVVRRGNNHNRNLIDREKDAWFAVGELAKGKTYREIAQELNDKNGYNLSHVQVWHDIEEILVEWKRENMANIDAFIAKELARLEEIESIVIKNFEKSKLPRPNEYASLMKRGMLPEEIDKMYEERGGMAGDPRYLETLLHLQKQRMDLLGISHGTDVAQTSIVAYNFGNADLGDLAKLTDALQDSKRQELVDEQ
jgi:hypothetical protein